MKTLNREQWLFCLQMGLAMMLAYFVTHGRDPTNAIYAVLGAGLVTAPSVGEGVGVSRDRIIGTLLGALASLSTTWLHDKALALGVTVVIIAPLGMMVGGIAVTRVAVTVMAVTIVLHTDDAGTYGLYRFTNTLAGVAVALLVGFLLWPLAGRLHFSATIRAILKAGAGLSDRLALPDAGDFPLDGQRKLFAALSALPKSITNIRLDPLLYREREQLRREAQIVVKISIALLSSSLLMPRAAGAVRTDDLAAIHRFYRHVAARLHAAHAAYPRHPDSASTQAAAAPRLPGDDGMPPKILQIIEELLAINDWLDELQSLPPQPTRTSP